MSPLIRVCPCLLLIAVFSFSCHHISNVMKGDAPTSTSVKTAVHNLADSISKDLANQGPIAWLKYFSPSRKFFMASEGARVFPDVDSANRFVKDKLVNDIRAIRLTWKNLHVDSLSPEMAVMSADFHEDLTDKENKIISADGYFTGLAEETPAGWKLRNLHWSLLHNNQMPK